MTSIHKTVAKRGVAHVLLLGGLCLVACRAKVKPSVLEQDLASLTTASELHSNWSIAFGPGLLAFANDTGEPGLFLLDIRHGGQPQKLPTPASWPRVPVLSADGKWIAYHELRPSEMTYERRLFLMDLESKRERNVVDLGEDERVVNPVFSPDSAKLAYLVYKPPRSWSIKILDLRTFAEVVSYPAPDVWRFSWTADGQSIVHHAGHCIEATDLSTLTVRSLFCDPHIQITSTPPQLTSDNRFIAFTVEGADCDHVMTVDLDTGRSRLVDPSECTQLPVWVPGAKVRLAYVALRNGSRVPLLWSLDDDTRAEELGFSPGVTYQMAAEANALYTLASTPLMPRSFWRITLSDPSRRELLYSPIDPGLAERTSTSPSSVRLHSRDGREVPVLVFPPRPMSPKPYPVILWVHGGPREDISPRWYQETSYLASLGVMTVAVNYRGSTGYGNALKKGETDIVGQAEDIRATRDYVGSLPDIDAARVFLLAESSGGGPAAHLLDSDSSEFRGAIQLTGWMLAGFGSAAFPPVLWLHANEPGSEAFGGVVKDARVRGLKIRRVVLPEDGHSLYGSQVRASSLRWIRRFVFPEIEGAWIRRFIFPSVHEALEN